MFSDYEIIEEIGRSQTAVVYRARKGQRQFALKVFHPLTTAEEPVTGDAAERSIGPDLRQPFLAAAKDQKKAAEQGLRRCAPIYEAGCTDDDHGAWYASEFYERGSIQRRIRPDTHLRVEALRAVVAGVVQALLDLQKVTGRSHGNLKPTNIFLGGGKGDLLRRTPLFLSDLRAGPAPDADAFERADLLALGELILQLVTLHEVNSANDYNYPLESSPAWDRLGKEAEFWRSLCNRLLDPKLSLKQLTLEKLANEVTPLTQWNEFLLTVRDNLPLLLAVLGVGVMVYVGSYVVKRSLYQSVSDELTVTSDNQSRPYGTNNPPLTGVIKPQVKGLSFTYRTQADVASPVGTYEIVPVCIGQDSQLTRYHVTTNLGQLTITRCKLTVMASNLSRTYGADNPPLSGSITVNRDRITARYSTPAEKSSAVGSYDILPLLSDPSNKLGNYQVVTNVGKLTITRAELKVMTSNQSRPLGAVNPPLTGWITPNPDGITATYQTAATVGSPVGKYDIIPLLSDTNRKLANYEVVTNKGTLTVFQSERDRLTVSADSVSRFYGQENPPLTGSLNPPTEGITLSYKTEAKVTSPVGEYTIMPVINDPGNKLPNFYVITNPGILTVKAAELTVTAASQSRPYRVDNPPLTGSITPPVAGVTASFATEATITSSVGKYDIVPRLIDPEHKLLNYRVITNLGRLTITQAELKISANSQSRVYGTTNLPTGSISTNRDGISARFETTAQETSPEGVYDIVPILVDPNDKLANYEVYTNLGKFTVTPLKQNQALPATNNLLTATTIDSIDYVWMNELGADKTGAYVAAKELSVREYTNLCVRYQLPVQRDRFCPLAPGNDKLPALFEAYAEVMDFLKALNLQAKGHATYRLPSLEEYTVLVGGAENLKVSKLKLERLKRQGDEYVLMNRGTLPSETGEGKPDPHGLFHVMGNVLEWTAEGRRFGVPYLDMLSGTGIEEKADISVYVNLSKPRPEFWHDYKGIRLIYVPASSTSR
jgi:hypothetical protein